MHSQKQQNDLCSFPRQTIQHHSNPCLCPTSNAEEAEVEWFYEDLQNLLEVIPKKDIISMKAIVFEWYYIYIPVPECIKSVEGKNNYKTSVHDQDWSSWRLSYWSVQINNKYGHDLSTEIKHSPNVFRSIIYFHLKISIQKIFKLYHLPEY